MREKLDPGVYVHLPFCSVHCVYCDFPVSTRTSLWQRYYRAILQELHASPTVASADTLYFGGGTPSLTPASVLQEIISCIPLQTGAEITMEINPDHVSTNALKGWRSIGITRLSLGIQSMEPAVLQMMLRQHTPDQALQALIRSREAGFENIGADLILGFPKQTMNGYLAGLDRLIEFKPEHISIYLLEIHERTGLYRILQSGKAHLMEESVQIECYEKSVDLLQRAGYIHYEVSNFALPGKTSRHNMKYWTDAPYFGYGAGACSYSEGIRARNLSGVEAYIEAIEKGSSPVEEIIQESRETTIRNALIFGLRRMEGIDLRQFESTYRENPVFLFGRDFERYVAAGLLEFTGNHLRLTPRGVLLSNEVLASAVG